MDLMEQLYTDFTTKLLPQVQEGLIITKEYFIDLFGRYVTYLIVWDSVMLVINMIVVILLTLVALKYSRPVYIASKDEFPPGIALYWVVLGLFITLFFTEGVLDNASNLAKDIFIPEVRVYEELKPAITGEQDN